MKRITVLVAGIIFSINAFSQANNVESFLRSEMEDNRIPGLQVAVVQRGKIVLLKSLGIGNIQNSVPVTNGSVFSINSCTKAFTGVAIMQLVEEGKLDIEAPVSKYLDGLPADWRPITIRQLLTHVSGLPNIVADDNTGKLVGGGGQDMAWAEVQKMPTEFAAGERYKYNQTNYVLLGKIIDKLSDKPFARFFRERQFQVAGMTNSGFGDSRDVVEAKTQSYRFYSNLDGIQLEKEDLHNVYEEFSPFRRTASGINSTAEDVARWIIALQNGQLLKTKNALQTLWTPGKFNDGTPTLWSLGWKPNNRPKHPFIAATGGSRSAFYIYPEDDLAIVILTNLVFSNPERFMDAVAGYYIPDLRPGQSIHRLRLRLESNGFKAAVEVARNMRSKDPSLHFAEGDLNGWGYRLLRSGRKSYAVEVFRILVDLYPESANGYDSLAEAQLAIGDKENAIRNYRRSLRLNPQNKNAENILKKLEER